jgi:uncharacterized membrane protein YhaH (DUF805 family)
VLLVAWLIVNIAMIAALDLPLLTALFEPWNLKSRQGLTLHIANLWHLWPMLALLWKRLKDIGHGWDFFAPIVGVSAVQIALTLLGQIQHARTTSLICLILLIVAGSVQGTRFISEGARD